MPATKLAPNLVVTPNLVLPLVKPFVKWVGGKSQLLKQFEELFPQSFNKYIEPMVGGGAVFFHLLNTKNIEDRSILLDANTELMGCYQVIKEDVENLILELATLTKQYDQSPKEFFYQVREWDREEGFEERSAAQRAGRTIFLNKTCYNGLYRVNNGGTFNTPFGKYKNPKICDEENLRAVSDILQNVQLLTSDFGAVLELASAGDFIYFDPPYHPLSETAKFTSYTKNGFKKEDQVRLRDTFANLAKKGCQVMLSNSDTKLVRDLYKGFDTHTVYAKRYINSNPNHRGEITEIVVTSY